MTGFPSSTVVFLDDRWKTIQGVKLVGGKRFCDKARRFTLHGIEIQNNEGPSAVCDLKVLPIAPQIENPYENLTTKIYYTGEI